MGIKLKYFLSDADEGSSQYDDDDDDDQYEAKEKIIIKNSEIDFVCNTRERWLRSACATDYRMLSDQVAISLIPYIITLIILYLFSSALNLFSILILREKIHEMR